MNMIKVNHRCFYYAFFKAQRKWLALLFSGEFNDVFNNLLITILTTIKFTQVLFVY